MAVNDLKLCCVGMGLLNRQKTAEFSLKCCLKHRLERRLNRLTLIIFMVECQAALVCKLCAADNSQTQENIRSSLHHGHFEAKAVVSHIFRELGPTLRVLVGFPQMVRAVFRPATHYR